MVYFFPSVDPLTERTIYGSRASVSEQTVEYQSVKQRHATIATPQIDRCKNKQEFSDFWAISYRFVHIVMLIIIQMHFVLLTTISLIFVWEGHFWKSAGARAPKAGEKRLVNGEYWPIVHPVAEPRLNVMIDS